MSEFKRINTYLAPLTAGYDRAFNLRDDVALLPDCAPSHALVTSMDSLVEGVHFLKNSNPERLAQKLLAVNLSDLAAKGATPLCYFLSLALPKTIKDEWLESFCKGLAMMQSRHGIYLAGGDSVSQPQEQQGMTLTVTIIGKTASSSTGSPLWLSRVGCRAGDTIYVTGTIGDGLLGLWAAQIHSGIQTPNQALSNYLTTKSIDEFNAILAYYETPTPRLEIGQALVHLGDQAQNIHAIDISDGLIADLKHLLGGDEAHSLRAELDLTAIPLSDIAAELIADDPDLLLSLLAGGDDYEILFTAPLNLEAEINYLSQNYPIHKIGKIVEGDQSGVRLLDRDGRKIAYNKTGYQHYNMG